MEGVYLRVDVTPGNVNGVVWPHHFGVVEPDVASDAFLHDELWFKCVPAGTFLMGSPATEKGREYYELDETQHEVTLTRPYFIGVTPVTRKQWTNMGGSVAGLTVTGMEGLPAGRINFTWDAASDTRADTLLARINQKTGLAGFALPTEAQWEYACRADTQGVWGDGSPWDPGITGTNPSVSTNLALLGWYSENSAVSGSTKVAHQVATRAPNAWGLYDFHGNVWEWCRDWAGDYPTGPIEDPMGPTTGSKRIRRGGSYNTNAFACRAAMRNSQEEINKNNQIEGNGIRFVMEF
jgi:formylglycine-generating enzyme required for sulfatase activity